mmetsp:Transcript_106458/g.229337  ORF Transcript_106458/g.229337 Transcript_106458/m.229337 type:complete len:92 (-) Transcript_106458:362-637(-)
MNNQFHNMKFQAFKEEGWQNVRKLLSTHKNSDSSAYNRSGHASNGVNNSKKGKEHPMREKYGKVLDLYKVKQFTDCCEVFMLTHRQECSAL